MTYIIVALPDIEEAIRKLKNKDPVRFEQVRKKLEEIGRDPEIGKPLRRPLQGRWRIHIGHFVLIYKINTKTGIVTLVKFSHHDDAY